VSIADSGCGIPDKLMSKIRDPFFTTKEVGKGTGLGLSIVEQIISSHDGEMIIDSEVGRGTNITVVLPIGVSADAVAESAEGEPPAANDDVLVASDVSATNNASQSELPAEGADNPEPDAVTA
jgi:chemotaxis protein histidine kinase CheA